MRPHSYIRLDLAAEMALAPGTTRQLAQRTGWAIGMTQRCLDNMCTAGQAAKLYSVRQRGVKRPVPVYGPAPARAPAAGAALQAAWHFARPLSATDTWSQIAALTAARGGCEGAAK